MTIGKTIVLTIGMFVWQRDGEIIETVTDFILRVSKITAAMKLKDACSLEEKL